MVCACRFREMHFNRMDADNNRSRWQILTIFLLPTIQLANVKKWRSIGRLWKSHIVRFCRAQLMRLLLFIAAASVLVGCRSTQIAYHAKVCNASNCCGPNAVVLTTNASETSSFSIEELVQLGLASNPSIEEAKQTICSLKQRIPQELSLPDPMVNTATHLEVIQY